MSLWSPQQHEWLDAMGLQVLVRAPVRADDGARSTAPGTSPRMPAGAQGAPIASRLERALLHALRGHPDAAAALASLQVDPAVLRRDPAARRALWPRLRALRAAAR